MCWNIEIMPSVCVLRNTIHPIQLLKSGFSGYYFDTHQGLYNMGILLEVAIRAIYQKINDIKANS